MFIFLEILDSYCPVVAGELFRQTLENYFLHFFVIICSIWFSQQLRKRTFIVNDPDIPAR